MVATVHGEVAQGARLPMPEVGLCFACQPIERVFCTSEKQHSGFLAYENRVARAEAERITVLSWERDPSFVIDARSVQAGHSKVLRWDSPTLHHRDRSVGAFLPHPTRAQRATLGA